MQFSNDYDASDHSIDISEEQFLTSKEVSKAMCLIDQTMDIKEMFLRETILTAEETLKRPDGSYEYRSLHVIFLR